MFACQLADLDFALAQFVDQLGQGSMLGTLRDSLEAAEYQVSDIALVPEEEVRPINLLRLGSNCLLRVRGKDPMHALAWLQWCAGA